jgi:hypothetical protein
VADLFVDQPETGRAYATGIWVRRVCVAALTAIVVLSLLNFLGHNPSTSAAAGTAGALELSVPKVVRGGLLVQGRIEVTARQAIEAPKLVLAEGWYEGMQVNTIQPTPTDEAPGEDRHVVYTYGALEPGDRMTVWIQLQVDPNKPGRRPVDVELRDGEEPIAVIRRDVRVLP